MKFGKDNLLFVIRAVGRIISGWSVGKTIIQSFRVKIYIQNKNIDHRVKEAFAIISTQVTYEANQMSLLRDSIMPSALNFCF